jgi:hypothetical protein
MVGLDVHWKWRLVGDKLVLVLSFSYKKKKKKNTHTTNKTAEHDTHSICSPLVQHWYLHWMKTCVMASYKWFHTRSVA